MKILYGITKSNFGGAQRYVYELAREAKRHGHEVKVVLGGQSYLKDKLTNENIEVISLPSMERDISFVREIESFAELLKILERENPQIFHLNSSKMAGLGALAARVTGVPKIVFTSHGWAFNESWRPLWQKILVKLFTWLTLFLSHEVISVSEKARLDVAGWPFIKDKLKVIHNGIAPFELEERRDQTFTIGTIGELHKVKGQDVLIRAWEKFAKGRGARLEIMGEGEERKKLEDLSRGLGVNDSLVFKGYVDNARSKLKNFDIFVFPSRSENLPYALLEAGLAGRPVIASSVGGIPEIIESGVTGILVPPEDPERLFSSLVLLSEDEELRKRLGTNLKASIQERFKFEKMIEDTFILYEKTKS